MHEELAAGPDAWGYRRLDTYAVAIREKESAHRSGLGWTSNAVKVGGPLGTTKSTAQVNPAAFTDAMMRAAARNGAGLRIGEVTGLLRRDGRVAGVEIGDGRLAGDAVVIAMGSWSMLATLWPPMPPVFGLKGHSVLFDTTGAIPPEALFLEAEEDSVVGLDLQLDEFEVPTTAVADEVDRATAVVHAGAEPRLGPLHRGFDDLIQA